jgi:IclR family transcriptional regulator, pca regulon regulatory protein
MKQVEERRAALSKSALVRGLLVLESFTPEKKSHSLTELSRQLGVPKSSLHRVVRELVQMTYLGYEEQSKRYYLGTRVLSLGFSVLQGMELREITRPLLEKLSRACNKTVNLAVLDRDEMVYVERIRVPGLRSYNISVGARMSVWNSSVGRVVLANLPPEKFDEMLKKLRSSPELGIDENELMSALADVKRDGFALNDKEFRRGFLAIAVPVFSEKGAICAINLVAEPEDASVETLKEQYAPMLIAAGKELSRALGHRE